MSSENLPQDWRVPQIYGAELRRWYDTTILSIGGLHYTRRQMIEQLSCGNFIAASRLTKALEQSNVRSLVELDRVGLHGLLRIDGVGERAAWVAACVIHSAEALDVMAWIDRDAATPSRSIKGGIAKAKARVHKQQRRRKRA